MVNSNRGVDETLDRPLVLGIVLVVLLIVGSAIVSAYNVRRLREDSALVDHTHQVVAALEAIMETVRDAESGHGILNLLVAVARALAGGDVGEALASDDGAALAAEAERLSERAARGVRGLLSRCGADPEPVPGTQLAGLGLLS